MIFGHEPWCNRIVTIDGKHYDRQTGRRSCGAPPEPEVPPRHVPREDYGKIIDAPSITIDIEEGDNGTS